MRLFSYKLTVDTGFAPNPFGETLTLATCKPGIRKSKRKGDWIAGFTSKKLNGDAVGSERLIYLMKVGEKLRFEDYFVDERFQDKIPDTSAKGPQAKAGDNIYKPIRTDTLATVEFEQLNNPYHRSPHDQARDLSGKYVLIADEYYYFGRNALRFGLNVPDDLRPKVPSRRGHRLTHDAKKAQQFIEFIRENWERGRHGSPHRWPEKSNEENGS